MTSPFPSQYGTRRVRPFCRHDGTTMVVTPSGQVKFRELYTCTQFHEQGTSANRWSSPTSTSGSSSTLAEKRTGIAVTLTITRGSAYCLQLGFPRALLL